MDVWHGGLDKQRLYIQYTSESRRRQYIHTQHPLLSILLLNPNRTVHSYPIPTVHWYYIVHPCTNPTKTVFDTNVEYKKTKCMHYTSFLFLFTPKCKQMQFYSINVKSVCPNNVPYSHSYPVLNKLNNNQRRKLKLMEYTRVHCLSSIIAPTV